MERGLQNYAKHYFTRISLQGNFARHYFASESLQGDFATDVMPEVNFANLYFDYSNVPGREIESTNIYARIIMPNHILPMFKTKESF